ncbi:MAG: glutaminyl-peptide cyclotransferase, partial [Pseudomonadota bacterium]
TVTANGKPVPRLNELEYINGEVWANVWLTEVIVRITPETGVVTGFVDMSGLYTDPYDPRDNVLNGIAYDAEADRLFVTGKNWPKIYEIDVTPAE